MLLSLALTSMILGRFAGCASIARQTGLSCTICSVDEISSANAQANSSGVIPDTGHAQTTNVNNEDITTATSDPVLPVNSTSAIWNSNQSISECGVLVVNGSRVKRECDTIGSLEDVHRPINGPRLSARAALLASVPTSLVTLESVTPFAHKNRPLSDASSILSGQVCCEGSQVTTA